jgi:hypothetical protein
MDRIKQLKTSIGKVGFFFNDENEKTHRIGRLKTVTPNGNCEDEDGCYYDNFTPMKRADLLEFIDLEFFS